MNHSKHNTEKGLEDLPSCGKTLYASALVTVNEKGYTKHYFEEGKRICSKIGSGELQNVNQLVDHMEMDYEEQRSIQTEGVTNTYEGCMDISPYIKNRNLYETIIKKYTTQVNSSEPAFYYHSDHLGSASYITGSSGIQTQQLVYLPFGEDWVDKKYNSPQYETPFKFNGKEKDTETGYHYYGARYLNNDLSIWLSVDPLSDKYPHLTSYNYCANNPVMLIDPDGRNFDDYKINKDRTISPPIKTNDKFDRFYMQNSDGKYDLIAQLDKNERGLVKFPDKGENFHRYGKVDEGGDHYLKPKTAAALFGLINEMGDKYPNFNIGLGDMSNSSGNAPGGDHKSHGGSNASPSSGMCIDFRYLNNKYESYQGQATESKFDAMKNAIFINTASKWGFNSNYISNKNVWNFGKYKIIGINAKRIGGHNDHGHIGY